MKKSILFLLISIVTLFIFETNVLAEEIESSTVVEEVVQPEQSTQPEVEEEAVTYIGEFFSIKLINETECIVTFLEDGESDLLTYILNGNELKLYPLNEPGYAKLILNEEDFTFEAVKYDSYINILTSKGGTIIAERLEGYSGDVIELFINNDILYVLNTLCVNGVAIEPDTNGKYYIELVEGENTISYVFEVDDEKLEEIAELISAVKNKDWDTIFNVENVIKLLYLLVTALFSGGFFTVLLKYKKYKTLTIEDVNKNVNKTLEQKIPTSIETFLNSLFVPFSEAILEKIDGISESNKILVRCLILMQEGTAEARLTILKELGNIKSNEDVLTLKVKNLILDEISKNEELITKRNEAIEELKQVNETIDEEIPHL